MNSKELLTVIKRQMVDFEATQIRPKLLEKIYQALLTIQATSVESERGFSATNLFVNKLRTSLDDSSVDNLCFLHSYL